MDGLQRFPLLARLITVLLSISCSNADYFQFFARSVPKLETANQWLRVKSAADCIFNQELLTACKKATSLNNDLYSSSSASSDSQSFGMRLC